MDTLNARAWRALFRAVVFMTVLLFAPAGTLHYWQAWLYLIVFMGAATLITIDLMRRDRALLERRLAAGVSAEKEPTQKIIIGLAAFAFAALLAIPAFERRLGHTSEHLSTVALGIVLVALGFAIVGRVYRENSFTSASVHVAEAQRLVSSGPYAIVRHPMYLGVACCLAGTPLALGSYWATAPALALLSLMVWRLLEEERVLAAELPGYVEYQQRVRFRLLPKVW
jgi:protein-S-isoprenylcysteine O-methyltransferase Ste14